MKLSEIAEDAKVPQKPRQGPLRPQTGAGKHQDKKKAMKQGKEKHKKPFSEGGYEDQFSLGGRLERDNDFRNRERNAGVEHERNNYQVSINGRPWKVFADQRQAMNIARSLKMKGKQVEVYPTGAPPSESIEEVDRRGFLRGLGAAALGATGIKAQASQDQDLGNGFKLVTIDIAGYTVKAVFDTQTKTYYTLNRRPDSNGAIIRNMAPYILVRDGKVNMAMRVGSETAAAMKQAGLETMQEGVREGIPYSYGFVPGRKKPNATTRHLRDYPVSDKDVAKPVKKPEKKKPEQGVAEGSGKNVVKSVKVGNFRHDLVDTGMGWQVRIYNGDELYDTGMSKNSEQKGLAALEDAVAYTEKQTRTKRQGVAEGSLETDNMVSHIGQVIQSIYPRGGDKNTYMKLVAQEMPHVVRDNPKLFRRAFGMAYDRFFHIDQDDDQDDDFDYTDYSMRQGERGMEEGVAGPKQCWPGHRKVGTQPGTGKNAGKRVNDCEKIKKEDLINLNNLDDFNIYLELLDHMIKK